MKQREVQDGNNIRWVCVQAFTGVEGNLANAAIKIGKDEGSVTVVCTPSGGAQTIRLLLAPDWNETITDAALIEAINAKT